MALLLFILSLFLQIVQDFRPELPQKLLVKLPFLGRHAFHRLSHPAYFHLPFLFFL